MRDRHRVGGEPTDRMVVTKSSAIGPAGYDPAGVSIFRRSNMRLFLLFALSGLIAAGTTDSVLAQKKTDPKQKHTRGIDFQGSTRVFGTVKGGLSGTTFVIVRPRLGAITVDGAGAQVRIRGRFASLSKIKGGCFVQVGGTMNGSTLKASHVNIVRLPGEQLAKPSTAAPAGRSTKPVAPPASRP
jgi:hypothetical protein